MSNANGASVGRLIEQTQRTRDDAAVFLEDLETRLAAGEIGNGEDGGVDPVKGLRGASSIERSIGETRRMIVALDRALEEMRTVAAHERTLVGAGRGGYAVTHG